MSTWSTSVAPAATASSHATPSLDPMTSTRRTCSPRKDNPPPHLLGQQQRGHHQRLVAQQLARLGALAFAVAEQRNPLRGLPDEHLLVRRALVEPHVADLPDAGEAVTDRFVDRGHQRSPRWRTDRWT